MWRRGARRGLRVCVGARVEDLLTNEMTDTVYVLARRCGECGNGRNYYILVAYVAWRHKSCMRSMSVGVDGTQPLTKRPQCSPRAAAGRTSDNERHSLPISISFQ